MEGVKGGNGSENRDLLAHYGLKRGEMTLIVGWDWVKVARDMRSFASDYASFRPLRFRLHENRRHPGGGRGRLKTGCLP